MNKQKLISKLSHKMQEDPRVNKILSKTKTTVKEPVMKPIKYKDQNIFMKEDFNTIKEKSKVVFGILNEVNKLCDETEEYLGIENSPERYYDRNKKIIKEVKDIQQKNKEIRNIMNVMTNEPAENEKGLFHLMELENVFKRK